MSKSNQKKITAVLASLSRAFDDHEAAQRSSPPTRLFSPFHTAQPTLTFLLSTQPLVAQLVSLQSASVASPPSPPAPPLADRLAAFTAWLTTAAPCCGIGETFAFKAGDGAEGNGVVALVALPPSALVMSIPRSIMVTASCFSSASSAFGLSGRSRLRCLPLLAVRPAAVKPAQPRAVSAAAVREAAGVASLASAAVPGRAALPLHPPDVRPAQ